MLVPVRVAGASLTAAGLAAWVLSRAGQEEPAGRCTRLQDALDEGLRADSRAPVAVPRGVVAEAVALWEQAAGLLEAGASVHPHRPQPQEDEQAAARLRIRSRSLRRLLE
ncbi:MAG TPA: hypothetical protein VFS29_08745 [Motilibacteraceae bacterium]|nr:hypothetical protein [Motilibacteraceae bacterium]